MKNILVSLFLLLSPLFSQSIKATYDVSFGVFGEIGQAEIIYLKNNDEYLISVHAWTTGLSATLTQNREEHYFSQGRIINGVLRPDIFVKFRKSNHVTKISLFNFNHKKKKIHVTKTKIKKVYSTRYDIHTM
jgi:hypothetical protein